MINCYKVLGVKDFASNEEIKVAYRKLSKKFHPDVNDGDGFFEELFKGIQNAYEILCDDKRKATHDYKLNGNSSSPPPQPEQNVNTESEARNPDHYFTIGSSTDHVLELQGTPTSIKKYEILNKEDWSYGFNKITFKYGLVSDYTNHSNELKVKLYPSVNSNTNVQYFTVGSTKDDVLRLEGTPTSVRKYEALNKEDWNYGYNKVTFEFNRVSEYNNHNRRLKVKL